MTALSTPPLIATATRSGSARRAHSRRERVRERVDRQRLAADRCRLEQRQPAQVLREPVGVRVDDPVAVDAQPDRRPVGAACRVAEELASRQSQR